MKEIKHQKLKFLKNILNLKHHLLTTTMTSIEFFDIKAEIVIENCKREYDKCNDLLMDTKLTFETILDQIIFDIEAIGKYTKNTNVLQKELLDELRVLYKTNKIFDSQYNDKYYSLEKEFKKYSFEFHTVVKTLYFGKYKHLKYIDFYDYFYNQYHNVM